MNGNIRVSAWSISAFLMLVCCSSVLQAAEVNGEHPTVRVEAAHRFTTELPWFGQVESTSSVTVPARTDGLIISIGVADESTVKQGDILFMLAGKAVESRASNLQQQLNQANTEVAIARKNLRLKRSQRAEGLATNEQVNMAANALSLAHAHASTARQALASLHVGTRITAPVDGVLTGRAVHVGQYVSIGMLLARIVSTQHNRIRASLFPPDGISPVGKTAVIHGVHADVSAIVSAAMPETTAEGGMQVWIDGHAVQSLMPGTQVSGTVELEHQGMAVPVAAIARDDAGKSCVFIRHAKGWRKQPVRTGVREGAMVEIRSGLNGGERIATQNVYEMLYSDFGNSYHEAD